MVISGTADLIKLQLGPERSASVGVDTIHQATERGAGLADQLLAFGRKQALQPRLVDLNVVIRNMQRLLESTVGGLVGIEVLLCAEPAVAAVDPVQIENAMLNLVINARDGTPAGGRITITTELAAIPAAASHVDLPAGAYVVVTVADTGSGMSDEVRARAFEPFFTTKGPGQGSGLGLSQVHGIVRQSGGTTEITSTVGVGTTVRIYLPRSPQAVPVSPRPPAAVVAKTSARSGDAHVLLVDDDAGVRATTAALLIETGYSVMTTGSGEAALREIERGGRLDLIVVDYAMPDIRGDQFAAMARRRVPGIPFMFITGYADAAPLRHERWVLKKPFRGTQLTEMAGAAIAGGQNSAARR
jgi:CheY-like chemotaxis protein